METTTSTTTTTTTSTTTTTTAIPLTNHVKLSDLNEFISCPMCHGYLIDATTVSECLHTFCKSCIVKHIKNDNNECPKCNTVIHEQRPLDYILHDRSKQDIVYKLVPQLYINEMNRKLAVHDLQEIDPYTRLGLKKKFIYVALVYQKRKRNHFTLIDLGRSVARPDATSSADSTDSSSNININNRNGNDSNSSSSNNNNNNNNKNNNNNNNNNNDLNHIYLKCPIDVRVGQIRKLLAVKYQLEANDKLVLLYKGDIISDNDQISNLAQSISFVLHYEISKLYPTLGAPTASTSSSTISHDSDKMSGDEIK